MVDVALKKSDQISCVVDNENPVRGWVVKTDDEWAFSTIIFNFCCGFQFRRLCLGFASCVWFITSFWDCWKKTLGFVGLCACLLVSWCFETLRRHGYSTQINTNTKIFSCSCTHGQLFFFSLGYLQQFLFFFFLSQISFCYFLYTFEFVFFFINFLHFVLYVCLPESIESAWGQYLCEAQ